MGNVGDNIDAGNASWTFEGGVAKSFDLHVSKSVPLYHEGHKFIAYLSDFFVKDHTNVYDIGSSTGELFSVLINRVQRNGVSYIGIEPVADMVAEARAKHQGNPGVDFVHGDVTNVKFEPASLITSYYTLQFISLKDRQEVINRVFQTLLPGGAFVLFEKVRAPEAKLQDIMTQIYNEFKYDNGFDAQEIFHKSRSLKGVMEPLSSIENIQMLNEAGFTRVMSIAKYITFEGFLAIK